MRTGGLLSAASVPLGVWPLVPACSVRRRSCMLAIVRAFAGFRCCTKSAVASMTTRVTPEACQVIGEPSTERVSAG